MKAARQTVAADYETVLRDFGWDSEDDDAIDWLRSRLAAEARMRAREDRRWWSEEDAACRDEDG